MRGLRSTEQGFTLVEVLFATGVWAVLTGAFLYVTQGLFAGAREVADQRRQYVALAHLTETWDAESSSALAIFVPPRDVLGADNGDGHELDFYGRDAAHNGHFWAYRWDRTAQALQRYTYPSPATAAVATDPPIPDVALLRAVRKPASAIAQPFLAGYVPKDVVVNFGYPGVDGGNALVDVTVANAHHRFEIELLPGTMASGFAVVVATFTPTPLATAPPLAPSSTAAPPPADTPPASSTAPPSAHQTDSPLQLSTPSPPTSTPPPPIAPATPPPSGPTRILVGSFTELCSDNDGSCSGDPSGDCVGMGGNDAVFIKSHDNVSAGTTTNYYDCYLDT